MKYFSFSFPGSAQLLFNKTKSVEFTFCNDTVVIPCFVTNMEAQNTTEVYVKWKFKGRDIYTFDGALNKSTAPANFSSAKIEVSQLLKGDASLKMDKSDAVSHTGNYTCEVTELTREGETIIELKYRVGKTSMKALFFNLSWYNLILFREEAKWG